jgi:hypothetical protein
MPANESRKPLYNALKYATSFPVIFLSAAQRLVTADAMQRIRSEYQSIHFSDSGKVLTNPLH